MKRKHYTDEEKQTLITKFKELEAQGVGAKRAGLQLGTTIESLKRWMNVKPKNTIKMLVFDEKSSTDQVLIISGRTHEVMKIIEGLTKLR